ncbi:hypothetical protein O3M35_004740 [Rhynocoris fuscipes]|uniref:Secreted protein n=1 Tax=Rhynocoris fuscipes TaxID=488301 RepID=A0AAW1DG83_9HEMI
MKVLLTILSVLCLLGTCCCSSEDISDFVDQILYNIRPLAVADHFEQIKVPGFHRTGLRCREGILSDLSTIERKGNCTLSIHGDDSAVITATLGLRTFKLSYPDCAIVNLFRQRVQLFADGDQVSVQISVYHRGTRCYAELNSVKLKLLQNARVYTSGYRWLTYIEEFILKWLIQHYEKQLLQPLYRLLWREAEFLSHIDICKIRG